MSEDHKTDKINIRMTPETRAKYEAIARAENRTLTNLFETIILSYLNSSQNDREKMAKLVGSKH